MNKTTSIIIILALIFAMVIIFTGGKNNSEEIVNNIKIIDGVQYVTINAKAGYSPKITSAKAGIPTKLIVKTNGTYDCSAALVIKSVGYQKILPQTGEEIIDLGTPIANEPLQGLCSMGMYNFTVNFN